MAKRKRFGRVRRYYGRASGYSRRHPKMTIPIAPIAGIVAAPAVSYAFQYVKSGDIGGAMKSLGGLAGLDMGGVFNLDLLIRNYKPIAAGMVVHVLASKFGLNRILGRSGVPFVRV